jgi:hypothetical protein
MSRLSIFDDSNKLGGGKPGSLHCLEPGADLRSVIGCSDDQPRVARLPNLARIAQVGALMEDDEPISAFKSLKKVRHQRTGGKDGALRSLPGLDNIEVRKRIFPAQVGK